MQFGIYSIGDRTPDARTGHRPTDRQRIKGITAVAGKAEEIGLDVFAIGEHHTDGYSASSPAALLAHVAANTERLLLSTAATLLTTNDPVRIAEEYATVQHLADGRLDVMLGRGISGRVYPWFGREIADSRDLAVENYELLRRLWREDKVTWSGRFRAQLDDFTSTPRPLGGVPPFVWHAVTRSTEGVDMAARYGDGLFANNIFWPPEHTRRLVDHYRARCAESGVGQAVVGLGGQAFIRHRSQDAVAEFRPYFDAAPVYGGGPSLEEYQRSTPLVVGSPQQVIDRVLGFREIAGDYQRQMFLIDHAGLPLKVVLEQLDLLGEHVVPVLRAETSGVAGPPAHPACAPAPPSPSDPTAHPVCTGVGAPVAPGR